MQICFAVPLLSNRGIHNNTQYSRPVYGSCLTVCMISFSATPFCDCPQCKYNYLWLTGLTTVADNTYIMSICVIVSGLLNDQITIVLGKE